MTTNVMQDKAVLVKFTDSVWIARKRDRSVAEDVAKQREAKNSAVGVYRKRLLPKEALEKRKSIGGRAREYHNRTTLPWMDDGVRVLPASLLKEYMAAMRKYRAEAEAADEEFFAQYHTFIKEAKLILGKLFNEEDYPDELVIRNKFGFSLNVFPLPNLADWRVDLPQKELEELRKAAEGTLTAMQKDAVKDLWMRLSKVIEHVQERLSKDDNKFKNSLLGNVKEMLELLPKLNIAGDAKLEEMRQEIEKKITAHTSDELRDDPQARHTVAKDAASILKRMAAYTGAVQEQPQAPAPAPEVKEPAKPKAKPAAKSAAKPKAPAKKPAAKKGGK